MHSNPFTFSPLFKLVFTGNFRPQLKSVDEAIRRRLYLIPFEHTITEKEKDMHLGEKLKEEGGGILNWMIEGCLEWQRTMLRPPARVKLHTADYLDSEDRIGRFLEDNVIIDPVQRIKSTLLYSRYKYWAEHGSEYAISKRRFMEALSKKGYRAEKRAGEQVIIGMASIEGWGG
jgi:putative DNA primase/helicase